MGGPISSLGPKSPSFWPSTPSRSLQISVVEDRWTVKTSRRSWLDLPNPLHSDRKPNREDAVVFLNTVCGPAMSTVVAVRQQSVQWHLSRSLLLTIFSWFSEPEPKYKRLYSGELRICFVRLSNNVSSFCIGRLIHLTSGVQRVREIWWWQGQKQTHMECHCIPVIEMPLCNVYRSWVGALI